MSDYEDIEALLQQAKAGRSMSAEKQAGMYLSQMWEAIMRAHDHTDAAVVLRENDMHREFNLIALGDIAQVVEASNRLMRYLVVYLVRDLNVAQSTVAQQAGVSTATVSRWINSDEAAEQDALV